MSNNSIHAAQLSESLHLSLPPVALAFVDETPPGIAHYDEVAPAGCYFWQEAAQRVFSTSAKDHELCAIGVHTHNLAGASEAQPGELMTALEAMQGLDYVREEEVAGIPVLEQEVRHTVYGPLADFPVAADVVLLLCPCPAEPDSDRGRGPGRRRHPFGDGPPGLRGRATRGEWRTCGHEPGLLRR